MGGASGYITRHLPPHLRFLLFSDELPSLLMPRSAVEMPQAAGLGPRSDQLADSVIPCSHPASIQRASLKEQISRHCCKCRVAIVGRADSPCMRMTLTLSMCSAWGNPTLTPPSARLVAPIARASVLPIYTLAAAIAAFLAPIAGRSVGRVSAVTQFLQGSRIMNPPRPRTVPPWDLPTVLRALKGPPFEPLQSSSLRVLSLKTALLLALASDKRIGDLQALSVNLVCLEFGPNDSKVLLKPRLVYVPKVLSTPFRAQVIMLSAFSPRQAARSPCSALSGPWEYTLGFILASYRKSEQLFVGFGNCAKGGPVTKQIISRWLVDAITLAYSSSGLQCPIGVRAPSTRGITSSWAWSSRVSISDICEVAGWSSPSSFARFYNLDVPDLQARVISA